MLWLEGITESRCLPLYYREGHALLSPYVCSALSWENWLEVFSACCFGIGIMAEFFHGLTTQLESRQAWNIWTKTPPSLWERCLSAGWSREFYGGWRVLGWRSPAAVWPGESWLTELCKRHEVWIMAFLISMCVSNCEILNPSKCMCVAWKDSHVSSWFNTSLSNLISSVIHPIVMRLLTGWLQVQANHSLSSIWSWFPPLDLLFLLYSLPRNRISNVWYLQLIHVGKA